MNLFADLARDSQSAIIGEDGSFEVKGLAKGVYEYQASVRGYRLPEAQIGEVLIQRDIDNMVIHLEKAPAER